MRCLEPIAPITTSPMSTPIPMSSPHSGWSRAELDHDVLDGERAGGGIGGHVLPLEDRHDLVADELVDVAMMLGDEVGLALEIVVEHLDHQLRVARLGE